MIPISKDFIDNLFSLKDKVALVTGATGALGSAIAMAYGLSGAKVVITGRNEQKLLDVKHALENEGIEVSLFVADPAIENQVVDLVKFIIDTYGNLDILAVSHGYNSPKSMIEQTTDEWEKIINADLKSVYIVCKQVAKQMVATQTKGKIIVVSSARSKMGMAGYTGYCASKGACDIMVQSMACELSSQYGINVNTINPTVFRSDLTAWMFEGDTPNKFLDRLPIGRLGEVQDFVGLAIMLASNASNFLTGGNYDATGGYWSC